MYSRHSGQRTVRFVSSGTTPLDTNAIRSLLTSFAKEQLSRRAELLSGDAPIAAGKARSAMPGTLIKTDRRETI